METLSSLLALAKAFTLFMIALITGLSKAAFVFVVICVFFTVGSVAAAILWLRGDWNDYEDDLL